MSNAHAPSSSTPPTPRWMGLTLRLAGIYNIVWGALVVLAPVMTLGWLGLDLEEGSPVGPLWQCIGMIVGVYGIGYWVAAHDPARHWPIVLVGLLGKIFGPIGFVQAGLIDGSVPLAFGRTILTNDLIWWIPFTLMLVHAYRVHEATRYRYDDENGEEPAPPDFGVTDQHGRTLADLSSEAPTLAVFLRHAGCTFCREALADLARQRAEIEARGARLALVHMGADAKTAADHFARFGLGDVSHFGDPDRALYRAFDLKRGTLGQLFGPRVWLRGFHAGVIDRHLVGKLVGDGFQMPGAFLLRDGRVVRSFRHADAADRPDYRALASV